MTIADHNYQAFVTLTDVVVGATATITLNDGAVIHLECKEVYDRKNIGASLLDSDGNIATGKYDFLIYTCISGAGNIRITQWSITGAENIGAKYNKSFNIDTRTAGIINSYVQKGNNNSKPGSGNTDSTVNKGNGKNKNK